jgi:hypothetical protein
MNFEKRSKLLRARFEALHPAVAPSIETPSGRGLTRSKVPERQDPRRGITRPTKGQWTYDPFSLALGSKLQLKWVMAPNAAQNNFKRMKPRWRIGVSPLFRIAECHPKRHPRE